MKHEKKKRQKKYLWTAAFVLGFVLLFSALPSVSASDFGQASNTLNRFRTVSLASVFGVSSAETIEQQTVQAEIVEPGGQEQTGSNSKAGKKKLAGANRKMNAKDSQSAKRNADDVIFLTGKLPVGAIVEAAPVSVGMEGQEVLLAYDIKIYANEKQKEKGETWQPADGRITVDITSEALADVNGEVSVYHLEDVSSAPELVEESVQVGQSSVSFEAESFSVYVIAQVPEEVYEPTGVYSASSLQKIAELGTEGFYLSHNKYYLTGGIVSNVSGNSDRDGLSATTEQKDEIPDEAAKFYFEQVEGAENQFLIYVKDTSGQKYVKMTPVSGNNNRAGLTLVNGEENATAFSLKSFSGNTFKISGVVNNKKYWWNRNTNTANPDAVGAFVGYSGENDPNVAKVLLQYRTEAEDDPFDFDGKTYGIMNYRSGTSAYAMMSETAEDKPGLKSFSMLVRTDPMDQSKTLYVAKDTDMPLWTIQNVREDIYTLENGGKYLRIGPDAVTLTDTLDEYCNLRLVPGTGSRAGKIQIIGVAAEKALQLTDRVFSPAGVNNSNNNQWHNFAEPSVYEESDFVEYTAFKVGASDAVNVANGNQVIIYIRLWNEANSKYDFYAIDHNGDLVPCYESGDSIVWIGAKVNTLLWDFTEYYRPGTTVANDYYDFRNTYSGKYLAPQMGNNSIFSDEPYGVNLTGRSYGDYYTPILAWDESHYDYAGLKAENGSLVPCLMSQTETFYFAVMKRDEHQLQPVRTVDHSSLGLTMKMVNISTRKEMSDIIGNDDGGMNWPPTQGLLSTDLKGDEYPLTSAGVSLGTLYTQAREVNNLFIQSVYEGSGYYQFDSSENFAHLNTDTGNFEVYQELGAVKGKGNTHAHGQFMPYNSLKTDEAHPDNPENLYDIYGKSLPDSNPRKYETLFGFNEPDDSFFAMEIGGYFLMPPNGQDAWGHDIIFDFVGDDDFWLYVDGELIIDLGGIHSALGASVNYSTGAGTVNGQATTIYDLFKENYKARKGITDDNDSGLQEYLDGFFEDKTVGGKTCKVFKDYSTHRVRIFYMERGGGASNLRMRFNLAAISPGQVLLSKEISGTDKNDFAGAKFPFQIFYREEESEEIKQLTQQIMQETNRWQVVYRHTSRNVEYAEEAVIDGVTYNNVFYLKPGETAAIKMPDKTLHYYIKECGVDTSIYNHVYVNNTELTGTASGSSDSRKDYQTTDSAVMERATVVFRNEVNPEALRTLTVHVKLWDENGNPVPAGSDDAEFGFRVFMGENLDYYRSGPYFVRNPEGYYCYFDAASQSFRSVGTKNFSEISAEDLSRVTFYTSPSGAVSRIPAEYSVEIRDLLVDTKFKVTAEDYDNPTGYGKRVWTEGGKTYTGYKRVEGSYILSEEQSENAGIIRDNDQPEIEVHFQRGWGIRAEKTWSDKDFMLNHDDTYVAVFVGNSAEPLEGSVHKIDSYNYTLYYFPALKAGSAFEDYKVREVKLTNPVTTGGTVSYDALSVVEGNKPITLGGTDADGNRVEGLSYTASYEQGTPENGAQSRTDTIKNTRTGGLQILVQAQERPLAGAVFELKNGEETVGTFTSDADGLVTDAYLPDGTYTLTQTGAPAGMQGLQQPLTLECANGHYTITGQGENGYDYDENAGTLTVINTPYTLKVVKVDAEDTQITLQGAVFSLYRQVEGSDGPMQDYYPMQGYTDITSDENGVIRKLAETLAPGGYYLVETQAPANYEEMTESVLIQISKTGCVTLGTGAGYTGSIREETNDGVIKYTIQVPNGQSALPTPTGVTQRFLPWILIALAGAALLLIRRRRKNRI